ncbi:MAG: O-antigen ligase family protein [Verrucomicrobiales bacterium]|nr:O-antigen ligase family protein [Verrucomicrobiales bacterium]
MEFYFEDHLRLDWGFGNPNKTAALIAGLLVLVNLFRYLKARRNVGYWIFVAAFITLGICLIHTYSRGGILAAIAGQAALFFTRSKSLRLPSRKAFLTALALGLFLTLYAALPQVEALNRYGQGIGNSEETDRSITNRLRIWKDVPEMMLDAPRGWGHGRAGESWMLWYQPMDTRYRYRTLVNSHLTWIVEFGWVGRFFYLAGWGLILLTCFSPSSKGIPERRAASIATGIWTTLAVSAFFSSVAESPYLWILPILFLLWMILGTPALRKSFARRKRMMNDLSISAGFAALSLLCLLVVGFAIGKNREPIHKDHRFLRYGQTEPTTLVIQPDERVVGRHYSYEIRKHPHLGWLISEEMPREIPRTIERIVLSGVIPEPSNSVSNFAGEIVYLNPLNSIEFDSEQKGTNRIILGSLRKDPASLVLRHEVTNNPNWDLSSKPGKQIYLGNWVDLFAPGSHP